MNSYRRDHSMVKNDEFERLSVEARAIVTVAADAFEQITTTLTTPVPSDGERLALRRAMARFLIDSGIASARGFI